MLSCDNSDGVAPVGLDQKDPDHKVRYVHAVNPDNAYLTIMDNPVAETTRDYIEMDDVLAIREVAAGANSARIISSQELEMREMLGSGEFGSVYKAIWTSDPRTGSTEVAVKTLNAEVI